MRCLVKRQAEFMAQIRCPGTENYSEMFLLYSVSPVLCGIKPAVLINVQKNNMKRWNKMYSTLRRATGLHITKLYRSHKYLLVLIYDKYLLDRCLLESKALALLSSYGYPAVCDSGNPCAVMLEHLKSRFRKGGDFPHEIGVFLGYPTEDVAAFIENEGRDCTCCRYWKVYHNPEQAREIFRRIDEAKSYALELLGKPISFNTAANLLRAI